jgi:hypothetical protein
MKTLKFNKNSWHYKLAEAAGYSPAAELDEVTGEWSYKTGEICSYSRYVGSWFLMAAFLLMLAYLAMHITVNFLFGVVFSIMYMTMLFNGAGFVGLFIFCIASAFAIAALVINWAKKSTQKTLDNPDSFIGNAYRSWKDKFCAKIEFN